MSIVVLILIVLALLLLRQNLFVILGSVTAYAYFVFAGEPLSGIILDAWSALNKDILLSIPLYILAGNIMAQGAIADRPEQCVSSLGGVRARRSRARRGG